MEEAIQEFEKLVKQYPNLGLILEYNTYCDIRWYAIARSDFGDRYLCNADSLSLLISKLWKVLEKDWKEYKIHG
jgi:hypothetical protein